MLVQLISGAAGGYLAGSLMKKTSSGNHWSSVAGMVGGVGGGILMALVGAVTKATAKK